MTPEPRGHTSGPSHHPARPSLPGCLSRPRRRDSPSPGGAYPLPAAPQAGPAFSTRPGPARTPSPAPTPCRTFRGTRPLPPSPRSVCAASAGSGATWTEPCVTPGDSSGGADSRSGSTKTVRMPLEQTRPVSGGPGGPAPAPHSSPPRHAGACGLLTLVTSSVNGPEPLRESEQDESCGALACAGPPIVSQSHPRRRLPAPPPDKDGHAAWQRAPGPL